MGFKRAGIVVVRKPKDEVLNEEKIIVKEAIEEKVEKIVENTICEVVEEVTEEVSEQHIEEIEEAVEEIKMISFESIDEYDESKLRIYCVQTEEIFNNNQEILDKYGVSKSSVTRCCRGSLKKAGKVTVDGEELNAVWRYIL